MGKTIRLTAADGFELNAYQAEPQGKPRGNIVLFQEIFGVNGHIRNVCERFAKEGYRVIAPALFDRVERDVELDYKPESTPKGRALRGQLGWDAPLLDATAAFEALKDGNRVGVVGYCWGGSLAFLSAARLPFVSAAVVYYGGQIVPFREERLTCPVLMHFGERDALIPQTDVEQIRAAQPAARVHIYAADHGFNCDERGSFDAQASALAWSRTLAFFGEHVG